MSETPGKNGNVAGRHNCHYSVTLNHVIFRFDDQKKPKEMEGSPLSKYVLIQFDADNSLGVFLSENLIFPAKQNYKFNYDNFFNIKVMRESTKTTKSFKCSLLLMSDDQSYLKNLLDQYDRRKTTIPKLKLLRRQVEQENKEEVKDAQVNDAGVSTQSSKKRKRTNKQDPDFEYGSQSKGIGGGSEKTSKKTPLKENISRETTVESKKKNAKLAMLKCIEKSQKFFYEESQDMFATSTQKIGSPSGVTQASSPASTSSDFLLTQIERHSDDYDDESQLISKGGTSDDEGDDDEPSRSIEETQVVSDSLVHVLHEKTQEVKMLQDKMKHYEVQIMDLNKKIKELELTNSGLICDRERLEYQLKVLDVFPALVVKADQFINQQTSEIIVMEPNSSSPMVLMEGVRDGAKGDGGESVNDEENEPFDIQNDSDPSDDDFDQWTQSIKGVFPIKESFVSTLSKTDVKTFVLNLLGGLYSKKFLTLHKMTNTSVKIGSELKIPIKTSELAQIHKVIESSFPGIQKKEYTKFIAQKFSQNRPTESQKSKIKKVLLGINEEKKSETQRKESLSSYVVFCDLNSSYLTASRQISYISSIIQKLCIDSNCFITFGMDVVKYGNQAIKSRK